MAQSRNRSEGHRLVDLYCTFDLDASGGFGASGGRGRLAGVRGGVSRSDDVEGESAQSVLVIGGAVRHRRSVFEPFDQRVRRVAFQTTLKRKPATAASSASNAATFLYLHFQSRFVNDLEFFQGIIQEIWFRVFPFMHSRKWTAFRGTAVCSRF